MNLRHAAAVALVGWYLMIPPLAHTGKTPGDMGFDTSAPISKWTFSAVDHFDTEEECNAELKNRQFSTEANARRAGPPREYIGYAELIRYQWNAARCVSDADPGIDPNHATQIFR
jgi:hypothetical protein